MNVQPEQLDGRADSPVVLLCEHARTVLPERSWGPDRALAETHWAVDLGIAAFTRLLARRWEAPAVLATFSRLWVDANRPLDSDTLFRDRADGRSIRLNADLSEAERRHRIESCYLPFHAAVDAMCARRRGVVVLSMHSFTPMYEGVVRDVEIGVLFDREEAMAERVMRSLREGPYEVRPNEPWSGRAGLMYSPERAAARCGGRPIELELRQDLLARPEHVAKLVDLVDTAIRTAG